MGGGIPIIFAPLEHEKDGAQHFVSHSDDGSFVTAANYPRLELELKRRLCASGGVSELTQASANVGIALADMPRLALSRRLVVTRTDTDSGSQAV